MTKIALDLGSSEFRSVRTDGQRLLARRVPAVYCVAADDLSNRRLLEQAQIPFSQAKGSLIVMGNAAHEFSMLVRCPVIPVVMEGHLPWDDPVGRQVCSTLVESLVPLADSDNSLCVLSLPASVARFPHEQQGFIEEVISLRGYRSVLVNSATALCLAELQDTEFSGVSLDVGAESIAISISQHGTPLFEGVFGQGFRVLENRFALSRHRYLWDQNGNRYLDLQSVRSWIRESKMNLTSPVSGDELWFVQQFRQLLSDAWSSMLPELLRLKGHALLKQRLPFVVSGGATQLGGFPQLVEHVIQSSRVPFRVTEARISSLGPYSIARGLLVHAMLEQDGKDQTAELAA